MRGLGDTQASIRNFLLSVKKKFFSKLKEFIYLALRFRKSAKQAMIMRIMRIIPDYLNFFYSTFNQQSSWGIIIFYHFTLNQIVIL